MQACLRVKQLPHKDAMCWLADVDLCCVLGRWWWWVFRHETSCTLAAWQSPQQASVVYLSVMQAAD